MRRILFTALLAVFLAAGFGGVSHAQTRAPETAATPEQAQQTPAGKFIQDIGNRAIGILADKNLTPQQRSAKYDDILHDAFDIPTIGHFVLGRSWNTATPAQQQKFLKLFQALVIKMYGERLNLYSGEKFEVKSARRDSDKEFVVSSEVTHPGGEAPTEVDWRVDENNGKLAVVDVSVDGVSQSLTQRQEYAAIIERNNGNIDALLDLMRQRLNVPSDATPQN